MHDVIRQFISWFELGTVVRRPVRLQILGFNIAQPSDHTIKIDENDEMDAIEATPTARLRRRSRNAPLDYIE